ncbi:hypothetical protein B0H19DRAFT_1274375 [Mycena capillaripes]|nr:hypothetical protein B0H19DRAFT_1274375 [Mycena capillaripes]
MSRVTPPAELNVIVHGFIGRLPRKSFGEDEHWFYYYVNFLADRDMHMRYLGGGVGHYQVNIPPEEDPAPPEDGLEEEADEPQLADAPVVPPEPIGTPPRTPEPDPTLPEDRPASSLWQNSDRTDTSSETGSEDEPTPGPEGDGDGDSDDEESEDEPNLGVEDGEGFMENEVEGRLPPALSREFTQ